jgi:phosphoribosyl 1,2-cyclic phosphodiesterase
MRADLLCSGSKGNSCLVRSGKDAILIDCGSTKRHLLGALSQAGMEKENLTALLVTHTHSDHISQLKHFHHLPVYSWCPLDCPDHHSVLPGQHFQLGGFWVTVLGLSHDAGTTAGYILDDGKSRLVYVTDTGYVPERLLPVMANADAYIFESNHDPKQLMATNRPVYLKQRILSDTGHLCNQDCALNLARIAGENTKHVILAHISQEANTPETALETFRQVYEKKRGPMTFQLQAAGQYELETISF